MVRDKKSEIYITKQHDGMVIVLAILIIAAVLGTAILFSNLVIREIMQSRLIDQSIQSYYLAESGSERALYQIRKREAVTDCALLPGANPSCQDNGYCLNDLETPCVNLANTIVNDLSSWQVVANPESTTVITLNEGETFQVDLFNPAQSSNSNINKIVLQVNPAPVTLLVGELTNLTRVLDVSGTGLTNCSTQLPILKDFIHPDTGVNPPEAVIESFDGANILTTCSYTFKLNYPINNNSDLESTAITINLFNANTDGTSISQNIPSRLIIKSSATFGNSYQAVTVRTPVRPPVSGLYDFVLFSGGDISKQ